MPLLPDRLHAFCRSRELLSEDTHNSRYDAFGEKTGGTGSVSNKYLFAGEQYDSNLGDYYLRARYYDTDTGRFTRRDTYEGRLSEPLTLHKYLYENANPVTFVDPTGLVSIWEYAVLTVLITGLVALEVTPSLSSLGGSFPLTDKEAYGIEQRLVDQASVKTVNKGGDASTFADLMQYTAKQIHPLDWLSNKQVSLDFLRMAVDILTDDDLPFEDTLGRFGNKGPRAQRAKWLRRHDDDETGWRTYRTHLTSFIMVI